MSGFSTSRTILSLSEEKDENTVSTQRQNESKTMEISCKGDNQAGAMTTTTEDNTDEDCCSDKQCLEVSQMIRRDEFTSLGIHLGIGLTEINQIETRCQDNETTFDILNTWRQMKGSEATQKELIKTLHEINRMDIVHRMFPGQETSQRKAEPTDPMIKSIQDNQREYFKDPKLPRILWLEKKLTLEQIYIELAMKKKDKRGIEIMEKIALEDMFQMDEEKEDRGTRIFIEGHPGFGKTTLLIKILSDWSRQQDYVSGLYHLVFLIPLRNFKGDLETHFHQQCHKTNNTKEEVAQKIQSIEGNVLVLLDGWDEATEETKKILLPVLRGLVYPKMTVVVTSRTGFHDWPQDEDEILCKVRRGSYEQYKLWDKRFQVKGISSQRRKEFLRKYLEIDPNDLVRTLDNLPVSFNDFCRCPLFLLLLGTLIKHKKFEEKTLKTKTQLYKTIFNFLVSRSLVKKKKMEKQVDLFDPHNSQSAPYRDIVICFGRLCLQKLKAQLLSFEEKEIVVNGFDIYHFGFLTKIVLFVDDEEKTAFEPIHKSFMEFLAAFYLSTIQETELAIEVKELFKARITPTSDQLVYPLLCGLLDADAAKLFCSLLPLNDIIRLIDIKSDYLNKLEPLLNEIANANEEIYNSLIQFVPKYLIHDDDLYYNDVEDDFPCVNYAERWVCPVVKLSNEIQIMKEFIFSKKCLERIRFLKYLKYFRIKTMKIDTSEHTKLAEINRKFKCRNLVIQYWKGKPWVSLSSILEISSQFCFWDRFYLLIDNIQDNFDEFLQICEDLTNGELKNVNVYQLTILDIDIGKFHSISSSFADLLKAKTVTFGIRLRFRNEDKSEFDEFLLRDILNNIVSSHILSLSLDFSGVSSFKHPIALPSGIFTSQRKWKYLELQGHFIKPESDENIVCTPINNLDCIGIPSKSKTLLPFLFSKCDDIRKLSCWNIEKIQGDILNGWKGFFTIESLELYTQYINDTFYSLIYRFQNLRKLKIIELEIPDDTRESVVAALLLKTISSLPHLNTLSIQCDNFLFLYNFLERLSCLPDEEKTKIPLKKLVLNSCRVNPFAVHEIIEQYKWITRPKGRDILFKLTEIQRKQYKRDDRVPSLIWPEGDVLIDSLIVHLESQDFMTDGEVSQLKSIRMKQLFDLHTSRILVEGSSPEENKIFCHIFLRYWAQHHYSFDDHFSLLFHIETKDFVNGASIEDVLIERFPGKEIILKNDIMNCINAYQYRILLILEGYNDEMSEETERILERLLLRRLFPKMNIMVTSNNGNSLLYKYCTQISKETSENDQKIKSCFDRRVIIKRIEVGSRDKTS